MTDQQSRIRGSLLAGAAGDALGYAVEFIRMEEIRSRFGFQGIREFQLNKKTQNAIISDDTQMTLFTAAGLLRGQTLAWKQGRYEKQPVDYVYEAYLDWLMTQEYEAAVEGGSWLMDLEPLYAWQAPGNTCLSALRSGQMGTIEAPINKSKGCGGVMRVAPVALLYGGCAPEAVLTLCAEAAAVTHGHPLGYLPAALMGYVIARGVYGEDRDLEKAIADGLDCMDKAFPGEPALAEHRELMELAVNLARGDGSDGENIRKLGEGWVGDEALAIALYCCLRYRHDLSEALIVSVNHDGDSDSTGAVTGNILGAWLGSEMLDVKWFRDLELGEEILALADDLYNASCCLGSGACMDAQWETKYMR